MAFLAGLRSQQFFPALALELSVVQYSIEDRGGQLSPMLSASGLLGYSSRMHQQHVPKTNKHLRKTLTLLSGSNNSLSHAYRVIFKALLLTVR
ncbi:hypothetical protein BJV78DRAFT_208087 [Lactifluus subvellereus]|nr:hypothetical protein BJV78DRAFT_208087 [Lactifluus subvellereus]